MSHTTSYFQDLTVGIRSRCHYSRLERHIDIPHVVISGCPWNSVVHRVHAHVSCFHGLRREALLPDLRPLTVGCYEEVVILLLAIAQLDPDAVVIVREYIPDGCIEFVVDIGLVLCGIVENRC
jgi:hypothetical protein